jgi:hydroxymethylbilane synthase
MLPAPAQGAVGIEALASNDLVRPLLQAINDSPTFACVMAERAFLAALNADCHSPVAAHAQLADGKLWLRAEILSEDGQVCEAGEGNDPLALAANLLDRAPPELRAVFG